MTDYDPGALAIAQSNAELNGLGPGVWVREFDWAEGHVPYPHGSGYDLIIGSDLLYSSAMAERLHKALCAILEACPRAVAVISHEVRHSVTWGPDKEPLFESFDSVLHSFLSAFSGPREPGSISYKQIGAEPGPGALYKGSEGQICLFEFKRVRV
mmetsp:Transcript_15551/g.24190  ORF Transcript_15551/g.24190 Transcript_15551/m.24190 type:complete len:155 (+) Transcript_15551:374-838(+)